MNLARLVERNAKTYGDRPALSLGDRLVETHASLALRCQAVAAHLRLNLRLTPGDKVALAMANVPDIWPALFGIWWAGLTAVPMNEKLHAKEFDWILKDSGARACFASPGLAEPIASVFDAGQVIAEAGFPEADFPVVPTSPETRAWLFYTSGTTGRPKGAILSHRNLMMMILSYFCDIDRVGPGDCILHAAPATHGSGMWGLAHTAGAAENVFPESAGFDPQEIVALSKSRQGLSMFAAPTMITRLVAHPSIEGIDLASLKTITYGGAPMYLSDLTRWSGRPHLTAS